MLKTLATFLLLLSIASLGYAQDDQSQYIKIHPYKVKINDSLCYQVREGNNKRIIWEPFCGQFRNFVYREGYEYTVYVKKYDPEADSMFVTQTMASSDVRVDVSQEILLNRLMKQKAKKTPAANRHISSAEPQFMKVYPYKIRVNDSLCYEVGPGYRKEEEGTLRKEPFCGVFKNLNFEEGKGYTLAVEKYDPQEDTLLVIRALPYPWVSKEALARKAEQLKKKSVPQAEFMRVHRCRIVVNDSLCYQVRKGYSRKDTAAWEPFCGEFHNFYFEEGYPHTLYVKEYNPHADTIFVIKEISRSSTSEEYMRKKLKEKRMRLKEKGRNDTIRVIPVKRRKER